VEVFEFGDKRRPTIMLLHGVGSGPSAWQPQISALSDRFHLAVPDVLDAPREPETFSFPQVCGTLADWMRARPAGPVHLVGLSLGAMIAVRLAADHPDVTASLIISGVQLKPPRLLMASQRAVMAVLPARLLGATPSQEKRRLMSVIESVSHVDLRADAIRVQARTLVLCGARDRFNVPASRLAARLIRGAELRVIRGAGHEWNVQLPELFTTTVEVFVTACE
jgi:3-oxoadipate enol-lactonase